MRIGIDVDGVLADFNTAFILRVIKETGKDLFPRRPFDIPTWNYPESYGYTNDEVHAVWTAIKGDPQFWLNLPPYADTLQSLSVLSQKSHSGNDLYFVTSRPGINAKSQTEKWLRENGFKDRPTVLISSHKGQCAEALDLDYYIDDRDLNVQDVSDTRGALTNIFLLDRPWNRVFAEASYHVTRISTLSEMF